MPHPLPLIPYPSDVVMLDGLFRNPRRFSLSLERSCDQSFADSAVQYAKELLDRDACLASSKEAANLSIRVEPSLHDKEEAYTLEVLPQNVSIGAYGHQGLFYALQTLRQLQLAYPQSIPCCRIDDSPSLRWRAFMLDVARSFCPVGEIRRIIDIMASFKLNVLHLHLSDDQGWRVALDAYPELGDEKSGRYTKQELKELVEYASVRQIMIIPEIDMPGHVTALLAAYPALSCTGGPFSIPKGEGIFPDILCVGKEETLDFVKMVLKEIASLFPSPYIHLGGDEIPLERWATCPDCQKRKQALALSDEKSLLRWFYREMTHYANSLGKQVLLYNDYVDDTYDQSIITQIWNPLLDGSQSEHQAILSDYFHSYLDMDHTLLSLHRVYKLGEMLQPGNQARVMGAELMLWTEYISTREKRDLHLFPRLLAGSEIFWTRKDMHEYHRFLGTCSQYGKLFLPPHTSITPRHAWDPPLIRQFISRWKRKRRVKRNSKMAGISFA